MKEIHIRRAIFTALLTGAFLSLFAVAATAQQDSDDNEDATPAAEPAAGPGLDAKPHAAASHAEESKPAILAASGTWWHPHPGTKWQIQYAGEIDQSLKVAAYDIDLVDTDAAVIQALHARGVKVICYFSAGSFEGWRPDARRFPAAVRGASNGWKGERWLDIRRIDVLKPIMKDRIDLAVQKGCDAVDPDNVEGIENKTSFPLSPGDQLVYNKMIADLAHSAGLAVGLKNDLSQVKDLIDYFDFAVNEQCFEYQSCDDLIPFIKANKPVFNIEYNVAAKKFCPEANKLNFDSLKKNLELNAKVEACR